MPKKSVNNYELMFGRDCLEHVCDAHPRAGGGLEDGEAMELSPQPRLHFINFSSEQVLVLVNCYDEHYISFLFFEE